MNIVCILFVRILDDRVWYRTNLCTIELYSNTSSSITQINRYKGLVIGGGNYFELWPKNSPTGTSIAMPLELFDKIEVPVFFNALGVDIA